ncbi:hypothetical protein CapIbe_019792 [Capra ibex]
MPFSGRALGHITFSFRRTLVIIWRKTKQEEGFQGKDAKLIRIKKPTPAGMSESNTEERKEPLVSPDNDKKANPQIQTGSKSTSTWVLTE